MTEIDEIDNDLCEARMFTKKGNGGYTTLPKSTMGYASLEIGDRITHELDGSKVEIVKDEKGKYVISDQRKITVPPSIIHFFGFKERDVILFWPEGNRIYYQKAKPL